MVLWTFNGAKYLPWISSGKATPSHVVYADTVQVTAGSQQSGV